jgi:hypothetical protein
MSDVTSRVIPGSAGSLVKPVKADNVPSWQAPQFNPLYQVANQQNAAIRPQSSADKATVQPYGINGQRPTTSATKYKLDLYTDQKQIEKASGVATRDFNGKQVPTTFIDMYNKSKTKNHLGNNKLIVSDD